MERFEKLRSFALVEVANHMGPNVAEDVMRVIDEIEREVDEKYVRLPKDANGEYVHVGDVMEWPSGETFGVIGIGDGWLFYVNGNDSMVADWTKASNKRHAKPTVEDVLREFSCVLMGKREFDGDVTEAVAEYAKRLQLRED